MKLVEYKHLLVSLKIKNERIRRIKKLKQKAIIKDDAKKRNNISSNYMTYFLSSKKHTNNIALRSVIMTNKVLRQNGVVVSVCLINRFLKQIRKWLLLSSNWKWF